MTFGGFTHQETRALADFTAKAEKFAEENPRLGINVTIYADSTEVAEITNDPWNAEKLTLQAITPGSR